MSDAALQTYIDKWLAAHPAQRLALPFLDAGAHAGHLALAALEQELLDAAYGIREPQVAAVKLNWWAEELAGAAASGGRHPLTQALFAAPGARRVAPEQWLAPVLAALEQLEHPTPADFSGQLQVAEDFHGALAALETAWWYGAAADAARARRVAALDHLLHAAAALEERADHERLPLPMARLARHGLDREGLARDGEPRREAVRAQLRDLLDGYREAARRSGPLSLFRGLDMRVNRRLAGRAAAAADPVSRLRGDRSAAGPGTLLRAWAAARAWRRQAPD